MSAKVGIDFVKDYIFFLFPEKRRIKKTSANQKNVFSLIRKGKAIQHNLINVPHLRPVGRWAGVQNVSRRPGI